MLEPVPAASEDVQVGESAGPLVADAAHAQVHHQAVGDLADPIRVDRVGQDDLALDEVNIGVGVEHLEAFEQVVLQEEPVAVEEEEVVARGDQGAQVA